MSNSFRVVFPDGTSNPIEGAVIRITGESGDVDVAVPYIMDTLKAINTAKVALEASLLYPPDSKDPEYIDSLYRLEDAMGILFEGIILPSLPEENEIITVSDQTVPEPEFWN